MTNIKTGLSTRKIIQVLALGLCVVVMISCFDEEVQLADFDGSYAVPLVDSEINIVELVEAANQEIIVSTNSEDQLTLSYLGDVVQQNVIEIFPPVPWFQDVVLVDTAALVPLPFEVMFTIERAKFFATTFGLKFTSQFEEDIHVTFTFPDVYKDGERFSVSYDIPYEGTAPTTFEGPIIDLTDWELITDTNEFLYTYDARTSSGERVELEYVAMFLEVLNFSYIEGFFGTREFPVGGSVITVGVFNKWLSGGFVFEEPQVRFLVENAFGFPVRTIDNEIKLTTISGALFELQAEGLEEGIGFNYPSLDEVGVVKNTEFIYNADNSNIGEVFNEKAQSVSYNVTAVTNSEFDETVTGFVTDSSYYRVQVALDVPLHLRLNDLKLTDTLDIDLSSLDGFNEIEFKFITENAFPFGVDVQVFMMDTISGSSEILFDAGELSLESGILGSGGTVTPSPEATTFITVDGQRLSNILRSNRVAVVATFSNSEIAADESFWILSEYGIKMRLGAIGRNE